MNIKLIILNYSIDNVMINDNLLLDYYCWIVIFWFMQQHNDTTIKTQEGRRKKTSLQLYLPLTLFVRFERVVQGLHVRGCWRLNINFIFWPPLLMTVTLCLSCSLRCSTRGLGVHCWMLAFFTASYQHLLWTPVHQGFKPHRPGVAFLATSHL